MTRSPRTGTPGSVNPGSTMIHRSPARPFKPFFTTPTIN
jgi:hypothetical protein